MSNWKALGTAVRNRRRELGLAQRDLRNHGGPSVVTVRLIEKAAHTSYRDDTYSDLERALQWQPGSCQAILDGGEPTPTTNRPVPGQRPPVLNYETVFAMLNATQRTVSINATTAELIDMLTRVENRDSAAIIEDAIVAYVERQAQRTVNLP